jgi:hypothetical protein
LLPILLLTSKLNKDFIKNLAEYLPLPRQDECVYVYVVQIKLFS